MNRMQWIWCYVAYKLYIWLPTGSDHKNFYGRFLMWLLGYGGAYAYSKDYSYFCQTRQHVTFSE